MGRQISMVAKEELVRAIRERYQAGSRADKRRILDEFVAVTGYHRKHAIRVLTAPARVTQAARPQRARQYDNAVREALVVLWEASDRVCGKRLKPLLPVLVDALERHRHLQMDLQVRTRLLAASAATLDRLLANTRTEIHGRARCKPGVLSSVRRRVPVRTFADWKDPPPGYMEADLVAHCGESAAGSFVHTLTLTDIATGWTECVALVIREGSLIVEAITKLRAAMPFVLLGLDTDNGSEFINDMLIAYCHDHGIEFTRSRPYRKNDQAWVEQKNGAVVRRLIGYRRLEGVAAAEALRRLYSASRLFVNFFQPSFKLASKIRIGAHVKKKYHPPATPCARLLASDAVPETVKHRLREVASTLDPLRLLDEIRAMQHQLAELSSGKTSHVPPCNPDRELEQFLNSLATAWKDGEVRPTHRTRPGPRRDWRTRKDPFEQVWSMLLQWLEDEPERTAKELFQRLQREQPGTFPDGQLRTLQRRVKQWRSAAARQLLLAGPDLARICSQNDPAPPLLPQDIAIPNDGNALS
jgi:hypothetical protein